MMAPASRKLRREGRLVRSLKLVPCECDAIAECWVLEPLPTCVILRFGRAETVTFTKGSFSTSLSDEVRDEAFKVTSASKARVVLRSLQGVGEVVLTSAGWNAKIEIEGAEALRLVKAAAKLDRAAIKKEATKRLELLRAEKARKMDRRAVAKAAKEFAEAVKEIAKVA